jgi:hypothetical protein
MRLRTRLRENRILFEGRENGRTNFGLDCVRTLRIPDDGNDYPLPPDLGAFPVVAVGDYSDKVPSSWRKHGGVIIPMWQREALWLRFAYSNSTPVALKVAAGKINAVTGDPWTDELKVTDGKPDYMVSPPQRWLDGFNTGSGVVRQFVAMPLGMGYTAEGQITGEENFGGIQIRVMLPKEGFKRPASRIRPRSARIGGQSVNFIAASSTMDMMMDQEMYSSSAVRGMGLGGGGKMRQKIYPDPYGVNTWDESSFGRVFIHIVNSEDWKRITGQEAPSTPVSAQAYAQHGYPWFDLYDEAMGDVAASKTLQGLKSVAQKDSDHGFENQMENDSIKIPASKIQKSAVEVAGPADEIEDTEIPW